MLKIVCKLFKGILVVLDLTISKSLNRMIEEEILFPNVKQLIKNRWLQR